MGRIKGKKHAATLERQKMAPEMLEELRSVVVLLQQEITATENEIAERQAELRDYKKRLRAVQRDITRLEIDAAEYQLRQKQETNIDEIRSIVERMMEDGMGSDEIIALLSECETAEDLPEESEA